MLSLKRELIRRLTPFFLVGAISNLINVEVKSAPLSQLNDLVLQCINTNNVNSCELALVSAEAFQRKAAERRLYSCQTYALGLGADLIMISQKRNRKKFAMKMMEHINNNC